jgi:hypothetical protein
VAEDNVTFLDALKALEMARQYMFQFYMEDSIIIMCNLKMNYTDRQLMKRRKQTTINEWLSKLYCRSS